MNFDKNLDIKKGDFFITYDGTIFECVNTSPQVDDYKIEGIVIKTNSDFWCLRETEIFTLDGLFDHNEVVSDYNIEKVFNKEKNPEYFL